jgi:hypothetical protein
MLLLIHGNFDVPSLRTKRANLATLDGERQTTKGYQIHMNLTQEQG